MDIEVYDRLDLIRNTEPTPFIQNLVKSLNTALTPCIDCGQRDCRDKRLS